jgi:hypothetical protein
MNLLCHLSPAIATFNILLSWKNAKAVVKISNQASLDLLVLQYYLCFPPFHTDTKTIPDVRNLPDYAIPQQLVPGKRDQYYVQ